MNDASGDLVKANRKILAAMATLKPDEQKRVLQALNLLLDYKAE